MVKRILVIGAAVIGFIGFCLGSGMWGQLQAAEPGLGPAYLPPAMPTNSSRYEGQQASRWSVGSSMGFIGSTPDGAAVAFNGTGEYYVNNNLSVGPLLQLGLTDDMTFVGLSGQGKYYIDIPNTQGKGRMVVQSGVGFAHADFRQNDTSWLVPLGLGYEYALGSGVILTATGLVNFTNLHTGGGSGADVMPGFAFGARF